MKKITQNITYIFFVFALVMSCGKKLEVQPTIYLDQQKALEQVDLMLVGAYSLIGSGGYKDVNEGSFYGTDVLLNADLLASENYVGWLGTFGQYRQVARKTMISTNISATRIWRKGYAAIGLCNTILEHINNAPENKRQQYGAEAKFIRGVALFELLRLYGEASTGLGVPILLQSTQVYEDITYPARATIDETYAQIIADLVEAKSILPEDNGVYADRFTASAFLARVYLQKGEYAKAYEEADIVINSNKYSLPGSVEFAFNTNASTENIFEIPQTINNNAGTVNDGLTTFYSCDINTPGSASRGDVYIDSAFIYKYDSQDKRRSVLMYLGDCYRENVTTAKWRNPYTNIPVIRLSEMYLTRAEAGFRTGQGDPLADLGVIREKAGVSPYASLSLDTILLERELELAFEGHRIHDFRRTGKTIQVIDEITDDGDTIYATLDYTDPKFILPIPQSDINTNRNLIQNSYYR